VQTLAFSFSFGSAKRLSESQKVKSPNIHSFVKTAVIWWGLCCIICSFWCL